MIGAATLVPTTTSLPGNCSPLCRRPRRRPPPPRKRRPWLAAPWRRAAAQRRPRRGREWTTGTRPGRRPSSPSRLRTLARSGTPPSPRPASFATCPGRLWSCSGRPRTRSGTPRVWATSSSATGRVSPAPGPAKQQQSSGIQLGVLCFSSS